MNQSRCRGLKFLAFVVLLLFPRAIKPMNCDLQALANQVNDIAMIIPNINFNIEIILQRLCDTPVCSSLAILQSEIELLQTNTLSPCCDFTSILDAISISEANIISIIDTINTNNCCESILDAISISEANIISAIDTINTNNCCESILDAISISEANILSAIDQITGSFCCNLQPVIDRISVSDDLILSAIDTINNNFCCNSILDAISISEANILSAIDNNNNNLCCASILDAISESEAVLLSAIDNIPFGVTAIDVNCANVDFTSVLDAISISEANILSAIDNNNGNLCCTTILEAISQSEAVLLSAIEGISFGSCCSAILNSISRSEVTLLSAIEGISTSVSCNLQPIITEISLSEAVLLSAIENINFSSCCSAILNSVSQSEAVLLSAIENLKCSGSATAQPCALTPITTATTITLEGSYCLANMIPLAPTPGVPSITVSASNVSIDLSGRRAVGVSILPGFTNIEISNGYIDGSSDGLVANGATNLFIHDILIRNASTTNGGVGAAINLTGVSNARVQNVELINNVYGMYIKNSNDVTVANAVAECNSQFGFELISSTTCIIRDSKALSTGKNSVGNEVAIVGFDSQGGYNNVFENCISNGTQGLNTTQYYNHLVAGFALRYTFNSLVNPPLPLQPEQGSKIINCESANAATSPTGQTVPYGIYLDGQFTVPNPNPIMPDPASFLITLTAYPVIPEPGNDVLGVSWRLDQQYFAIIHNQAIASRTCANPVTAASFVDVYIFDNDKRIASKIDSACLGTTINAVAWSPDGTFIATAGVGVNALAVFQFCTVTNKLTLVAHTSAPTLNDGLSVSWSPNGNFLAIGTDSATASAQIAVYRFDRAALTLQEITATNVAGTIGSQKVNTVAFSPDGRFIAAGLQITLPPARLLQVYSFDQNLPLTMTSFELEAGPVREVRWSPDGKFIAAASGTTVFVYPFLNNGKIGDEAGEMTVVNDALSVDWSNDGQYIVVSTAAVDYADEHFVKVYKFDRSNPNKLTSITLLAIPDQQPNVDLSMYLGEPVHSVRWSPDGRFILAGSENPDTGSGLVLIYQALQFVQGNVVDSNTVYYNSGNQYPGAIGISGSSIQNTILYNTAYSNPVNPFMVNNNYAFVTNVFNDLFGMGPTELQNVSIDYNKGLRQPEDPILLLKQIKAMVTGLSACEAIAGSASCDLTAVLNAISQSEAAIISAIDLINVSRLPDIHVNVTFVVGPINITAEADLTSVLDAISVSEAVLLSAIEAISFTSCCNSILNSISQSEAVLLSAIEGLNVSVSCNLQPVLNSISVSEAVLLSAIEAINASASCNLQPVLSSISQSEAVLLSAIEAISGSFCCNLQPVLNLVSQSEVLVLNEISQSEAILLSAIEAINGSFCCNLQPILDSISQSEAVLLSAIENIKCATSASSSLCAPTPITTPTVITTEGSYCVANMIVAPGITVSASNVSIDLSGRRVVNVVISPGATNVEIGNGFIDGASDGLKATNASNLFIHDILIRNATISGGAIGAGINFTGVSNARVQDVQLINNVYGMYINGSDNITVANAVAEANSQFGFELISSSTCLIRDSKALSTGTNSVGTEPAIVGFDSQGGYNNVFENCISNGTVGAQTTAYLNHLVAGFALRYTSNQAVPFPQPLQPEQGSKIINCEAANATTNASSTTNSGIGSQNVPYGIYLDGQFAVNPTPAPEFLITLTAVPVIPEPVGNGVLAVSWRLDQQYFAIAYDAVFGSRACANPMTAASYVDVYIFDNNKRIASKVDNLCFTSVIKDVKWSPDGTFIATAGMGVNTITVSQFCSLTNKLGTPITATQLPVDEALTVDWSPNGNFIAIGTMGSPAEIWVYNFDRAAQKLTKVTSITVPGSPGTQSIDQVEFSPDGRYIAVVCDQNAPSGRLQIYSFNQNTGLALTSAVAIGDANDIVRAVEWSPDGKYVAANSGDELYVFPVTNGVLGSVRGEITVDRDILALDWSGDGKYIAISTDIYLGTEHIYVYTFDRASNNFMTSLIWTAVANTMPNGNINALEWSPDGRFILVGSDDANLAVGIYQALQFVQDSVVTNNTVYCNSGNMCPGGIGISGSSIQNMILQNTSYSNPINPIMVDQNYVFVTNVFNDLFGPGPTGVQNISINYNRGIRQPEDPILLLKQIKNLVSGLSVIEAAASAFCDLNVVLNAISQSEAAIISAIDLINVSRLPDIHVDVTFVVGPINVTAVTDLTSVLDAISVSEAAILSAIAGINTNLCCVSILDAISQSEVMLSNQISRSDAVLLSAIEAIGFSANCNLQPVMSQIAQAESVLSSQISQSEAVLLSAIEGINFSSCCSAILNSISQSEAALLSAIEGISLSANCNLQPIMSQVAQVESVLSSQISQSEAVLLSAIEHIPFGVTAINVHCANIDFTSVLDAISVSEAVLLSAIEGINASVSCNLQPVLNLVSQSEAILLSAIDHIPFGATAVSVICNANVDFTSVLDAISVSEANILSALDRISVSACCDFTTILDAISASEAAILSALDLILSNTISCAPTPISTPTTITAEGSYCVRMMIPSPGITISASNVTLDLSGRRVTNVTISPNTTNVEVSGGFIDGGSDGLKATNATNLFIHDLTIRNATTSGGAQGAGINFTNVANSQVQDVKLINNIVGMYLNQSNKITIDNVTADRSQQYGFELISSSTNCLRDCRALATGEGDSEKFTGSTGGIVGFSSVSGYSNIFERCIANSTQGLSVTGFTSVVAGFRLGMNTYAAPFASNQEMCSKIIDCEAANATVASNGFTTPYGILLQGELVTQGAFTTTATENNILNSFAVAWSPDGKYFATAEGNVGSNPGQNHFYIYEFDRVQRSIIQRAGIPVGSVVIIQNVSWSSFGNYIAFADQAANNVYVYQFEPLTNTLTQIDLIQFTGGAAPYTVAWSSDDRYLAITDIGNGDIHVYNFNQINLSLTPLTVASGTATAPVSVSWSPDGNYLTIADMIALPGNGGTIQVYLFDAALPSLELVASSSLPSTVTLTPVSVAWSPNGKYIAALGNEVGGSSPFDNDNLYIFRFDRSPASLTLLATVGPVSFRPRQSVVGQSVIWSPDDKYVATAGNPMGFGFGNAVPVYLFDPSIPSVTLEAVFTDDNPEGIAWSPDGQYLLATTLNSPPSPNILIYEVINFPSQTVVKGNVVYCNSGGITPQGVGISGSSIANYIVGNTAYSNPCLPFAGIDSNYIFVTNVFSQLFGNEPSDLQNLSLECNQPIVAPENVALLIKQLQFKLTSQIDMLPCARTIITAPTTITAEGSYCVANMIPAPGITVTADNVSIDLSGRRVVSISITGYPQISNVEIGNGFIDTVMPPRSAPGSFGLSAFSASNLFIHDLIIRNVNLSDVAGIEFTNVANSYIKNIQLINNSVGMYLESCQKITIDNVIADRSIDYGFQLISSSTCSLRDCQALATGEDNNAVLNNIVIGFSSINGFGNIFERCIANATQAVSTTDFNSLVAGFALQGTEGCSKIIDCEAANATVNSTGVTVPYGILLKATLNNPLSSITTQVPQRAVSHISWRADEKYIAASESTGLFVYLFDNDNHNLMARVATNASQKPVGNINEVRWSPDGTYVAVANDLINGPNIDNADVRVYSFDSFNNTLNLVSLTQTSTTGVNTLAWSPNGQYIATGDKAANVGVLKFDRVAQQLSTAIPSIHLGAYHYHEQLSVNAIDWNPNGELLAVGTRAVGPSGAVFLLQVAPAYNQLGYYNYVMDMAIDASPIDTIAWSPNGKHIAAGSETIATLLVFTVDYSPSAGYYPAYGATLQPSPATVNITANSVSWSPDGQYIGVFDSNTNHIHIYQFDPTGTGFLVGPLATGATQPGTEIAWSPSGEFIAFAGSGSLDLYKALTFPSNNVIKGNVVYCNSGGMCPQGVGISGSSVANYIVGNTAYSNPCPPVIGVGSNYQFVTNVFSQLFGQAPSALQNISIGCNEQVVEQENTALLIKQLQFKLTSQIDLLLSNTITCAPIPIYQSNIPTTITQSGYYCLAQDVNHSGITPAITIATNNVTLDLNNHTVTTTARGIRVISADTSTLDNITIRNGTLIDTGRSLDVSNVTNIYIENINIENALIGIGFIEVTNGFIKSSFFKNNAQGLELSSCAKIVVEDTISEGARRQGFSLIASSTCVFRDCQALSTGEGNPAVNAGSVGIVGFSAVSGYSNIFERCIANATGNLTVTGFGSVVAGFRLSSGLVSGEDNTLHNQEQCTKIIDCEACNAMVAPIGATVPYGILLQAQFDGLISVTEINPGSEGAQVNSISWTSDGKYLAVGGKINGQANNDLFIYKFDYVNQILIQVFAISIGSSGDNIDSVAWSPDNNYLAVGGAITGNTLYVYNFDRDNEKLSLVQSLNPLTAVHTVAWSSDSKYLAVGGFRGDNNLYLYKFDRVAQALSQVYSTFVGIGTDTILTVVWSPDGNYLAVAGSITGGGLIVYTFDRNSQTVTPLAVRFTSPYDSLQTVAWSPDGAYLAAGGSSLVEGNLVVLKFDPNAVQPLMQVAAVNPGGAADSVVYTIDWSPDGTYLAIGGDIGYLPYDTNDLYVYLFDRGSSQLTELASAEPGSGGIGNDKVFSVVWSPDGQYLAVGGEIYAGMGNDLFIYRVLSFPSQNIIQGNIAYCNSGGVGPQGVGISGSSIANYIVGNTAYSNPCPYPKGGLGSNYEFVTNVFNQLFGQAPSDLQNIGIRCNEPICAPEDTALLIKQAQFQLGSKIDLCCNSLSSQLDVVSSQIEALNFITTTTATCAPTPIFVSNIPTTITQSGYYCLAQDVNYSGFSIAITISANNVTLDLNNHTIHVTNEAGITANGFNQITIRNGTVISSTDFGGDFGIFILNGSDISLSNLLVEGANIYNSNIYLQGLNNVSLNKISSNNGSFGIDLEAVNNAHIKNSSFEGNNHTGVLAHLCNRIVIENSIASDSQNIGFDLSSSFTCCLRECKALGTGYGNITVDNATIVGFSAENGASNIFERCIANGTQALSATSQDSTVAGFLLQGTEGCTKIIDCEASNATVASNGYAIPYGILLQAQVGALTTLTTVDPAVTIPPAYQNNQVQAVDWSPDGRYVAAGLGNFEENPLLIYKFNYQTQAFELLIQTQVTSGANFAITSVAWSPDGIYLAVTGQDDSGLSHLFIYRYEPANNTLTQLVNNADPNSSNLNAIAWSPNEQFLALGRNVGPLLSLELLAFDIISQTAGTVSLVETISSDVINAVNWSPDSNYVAFGGTINSNGFTVYQVDQSSQQLINPVIGGSGFASSVQSIDWSPDGKYIAVGSESQTNIRIYSFNSSPTIITLVLSQRFGGPTAASSVFSLDWSPDGNYLAVGGSSFSVRELVALYSFDRGTPSLNSLRQATPFAGIGSEVRSLVWSPDGQYLAIGGLQGAVSFIASMVAAQALTFPSDNVIKGNVVYCNSGGIAPQGVGISGSSIANYIVGNTAYSNPCPITPNGVGSNYQFVTNVFSQIFGNEPSALQNIGINCNEPIVAPDNVALLVKQLGARIGCTPIPITQPTVITQSGVYCVANRIEGQIVVENTNFVTIVGNGPGASVSENISIVNSNNVDVSSVQVIGGSPAFQATNASNLRISNIFGINGDVGIILNNVSHSTIQYCDLIQNSTAIQLNSCNNIVVDTCYGLSNKYIGVMLNKCNHCTIQNTQMLLTGSGNFAKAGTQVYGFVSTDGSINTFNNCIANATQALSTTDCNSIVAGFALIGTEHGTFITNNQCSGTLIGTTTYGKPYGILLEGAIDSITSVTAWNFNTISNLNSVDWTPDGQYLAVGGALGLAPKQADVRLFSFNRQNGTLTQIQAVNPSRATADQVINRVKWSPLTGSYLAVVGDSLTGRDLVLYSFNANRGNQALVELDNIPAIYDQTLTSVAWEPNEQYLVVCGEPAGYSHITLFKLNGSGAQTLIEVGTPIFQDGNDIAWNNDGIHIAVGSGAPGSLITYEFDRSTQTLTNRKDYNFSLFNKVGAVAWSPDGTMLASLESDPSKVLNIWSLDQLGNLHLVASTPVSIVTGIGTRPSLDWSSDGIYLAVTGLGTPAAFNPTVYKIDCATPAITPVATYPAPAATYLSMIWSPHGDFIALAGDSPTQALQVLTGLEFPTNNTIQHNTISLASTNGIGISGSGAGNTINQNNVTGIPDAIPVNFAFIPQVYTAGAAAQTGLAPASNLNFFQINNQAVTQQFNLPQATNQIQNTISTMPQTTLAPMPASSFINNTLIGSLISSLVASNLIALTDNVIVIQRSGDFAPPDSTGDLDYVIITASDARYNHNNKRINKGIIISPVSGTLTDVIVKNATLSGAAQGIYATNVNDLQLENITAVNGNQGIYFNNIQSGLVQNCDMHSNETGMQIVNSGDIVIQNCRAFDSNSIGFELVNSTSCSFQDCQSVSTGVGNHQTNNALIAGFLTTSGYANIFERCIANGTQALTTTDFDSIVGGFVLRGTESSTKIVNSESGNTQTKTGGLTIPYGILLEATVNSPLTLTAVPPIGGLTGAGTAIAWSTDSNYLAAASATEVAIFGYDIYRNILTRVTTITPAGAINSVSWSPDGTFFAVGSGSLLSIYQWDFRNQVMNFQTSFNLGTAITSISWSPDARFIATSNATGGPELNVFNYNSVSNVLTLVASSTVGSTANSVSWSADAGFLATGNADSFVRVYSFANNTLGGPITANAGAAVNSVAWSLDGTYLVAGSGTFIKLYLFNRNVLSFTQVGASNSLAGTVNSVAFSGDGRHIAAGLSDQTIRIFNANPVTPLMQQSTSSVSGAPITQISWNPDGSVIAGTLASTGFVVYEALTFPIGNVIQNNLIYASTGDVGNRGIGLSGSSIKNAITLNTSYANPQNPLGSATNYAFVTNIFNQLFGQAPTGLQNISITSPEAFSRPLDIGLLVQQIKFEVGTVGSQIANFSASLTCNFAPIIEAISVSDELILSAIGAINMSRLPDIHVNVTAVVDFTTVLEAISQSEAVILSAIDHIPFGVTAIDIHCNATVDFTSVLDAISQSQAVIISAIDNITPSVSCNLQPILNQISLSEAQLFSELEVIESKVSHLPFGATAINVNVSVLECNAIVDFTSVLDAISQSQAVIISAIDNITPSVSCNLQPVLNQISLSEAQIFSELEVIESKVSHLPFGATAINVNISTQISVAVSAIENIQPILSSISLAEAQLFSELEVIESKVSNLPFGATTIKVTST